MKILCKCIYCGKVRCLPPSIAKGRKFCSISCEMKYFHSLPEYEGPLKKAHRVGWKKGLTKETDARVAELGRRQSLALLGRKNEGASIALKARWKDPEYAKKQLILMQNGMQKKPNNLEIMADNFLSSNFPGTYRYVGDRSLWFTSNGKHLNPDFIHKAEPKVIEILGLYWHPLYSKEKERQMLYESIGYKCLLVYDFEFFNESMLLERVHKFHEVA